MDEQERQLKRMLTGQRFHADGNRERMLEAAKALAGGYAMATDGIAVLSDFQNNVRHIFSGRFGRTLGLPEYVENNDSAFEREVFDNIPHEELLERHILELRFFNYLKTVHTDKKTEYVASCLIHFRRADAAPTPILHTTRYLHCQPDGCVSLGLCTYVPMPLADGNMDGGIMNACTGEAVKPELYGQCDGKMISGRQAEILSLLAKGYGSKQIADRLNISIHTVSRHRQDILSRLNVTNTTAAVEIAIRMRLI